MNRPEEPDVPIIRKRFGLPPGTMPRYAQAWVLGGIAGLMVLVIALTGNNAPQSKPRSSALPIQAPIDPDAARISEYRARIEEQMKKLTAAHQDLAARSSTLSPQMPAADPGVSPQARSTSRMTFHDPYRLPADYLDQQPRRSGPDKSLLASNVALSYRPSSAAESSAKIRPPLLESFDMAALAEAYQALPSPKRSEDPTNEDVETFRAAKMADKKNGRAQEAQPLDRAKGPLYRVFEGTFIETVLLNRLDGDFSGPVTCMASTDLYSRNRQHLLIPRGSRLLGQASRVDSMGQTRLSVVFHRLIMPDGFSVNLEQFQGLNQQGETGLRDKVNHHYLRLFGVSIAIGAIAGLSQANTRAGFDASAADVYRQGVASSLSQSALRILDRYLNILPTITITEGHRVKVYLSEDLELPDYQNHQMPSGI